MMLDDKTAILICAVFIGGLCYVVHQVALPVVAVAPSVLESSPVVMIDAETEGAEPITPTGLSSPFARRSPFEPPVEPEWFGQERLAVAEVPEPAELASAVVLPPPAAPTVDELFATAVDEPPLLPEPAVVVVELPGSDEPSAAGSLAAAEDPRDLADSNTFRPSDQSTRAASFVAAAAPPRSYTVRRGDSLAKVCRREWNRVSPELIALLLEANPKLKPRPDRVFPGEQLTLPEPAAVTRALWPERPTAALAAGPAAGRETASEAALSGELDEGVLLASAAGVAPSATTNPRWYTIRERDSLAQIAQRELNDGRRWREIAAINGLRQPDRIVPGWRIRLP